MTELSHTSGGDSRSSDLDSLFSQNSSCAGLFSEHNGIRTNVCKTPKASETQAGEIVFSPAKVGAPEDKTVKAAPDAKIVPVEPAPKTAERVLTPKPEVAREPGPGTTGSLAPLALPVEARVLPAPQIKDPSGFDLRIAMSGAGSNLYGSKLDLGFKVNKEVVLSGSDGKDLISVRGVGPWVGAAPEVAAAVAPDTRGAAPEIIARADQPRGSTPLPEQKPVTPEKAPAKALEKEPAHEPPVLPAGPMNPLTALFNIFTPSPYIAGQATPYDASSPPHAVPFGRPGETVPSRILYPNAWSEDYLNSVENAAQRIYKLTHGHTGDCGRGIREGANDMDRGFNMFSDTQVGDVNLRWRSAMQIGDYLYATGLFDKYPLAQMKHQLRDGFTVVRPWTDAVNNVEKWKTGGENKGDIAVVSHNGYQYNDHTERFEYNNGRYDMAGSYVLVPKGYDFARGQVMPIGDPEPGPAHGRGRGRAHVWQAPPAHRRRHR